MVTTIREKDTLKRGRDQEILPIDFAKEAVRPTSTEELPDRSFDQQWAAALLERTLTELESDYVSRGKGSLFQELRPYLGWSDEATEPHEDVAQWLGMNVGALRMSLLRLRKKFGDTFRKQVSATLPTGGKADIEEEIRYLMSLFA